MEDNRYVVIDKDGGILCISGDEGKTKIVSKPLSEINLNTIFVFWSSNMDELKAYSSRLEEYFSVGENPFSEIDFDSCTFMEINVNNEDGTFSLG